ETRDGKRYMVVDPLKKAKAPLFDNAKMAAMLTAATLVPMDAQHLPIKTLKTIRNDGALRVEVEVPKDADVPGRKRARAKPTTRTGTGGGGGRAVGGGMAPQQGRGGKRGEAEEGNREKKSVFLESALGRRRRTLLPD